MAYDINKALERLEENLKNLDSARRQVENTVNASDELRKIVQDYVSSVTTLRNEIKVWKEDIESVHKATTSEINEGLEGLKSVCTQSVEVFGDSVTKTSSAFKEKANALIDNFSNQNDALKTSVGKLDSFQDDIKKVTKDILTVHVLLESIAKDLRESQTGQDRILEQIDKNIADISPSIDGHAKSMVALIDKHTKSIAGRFDEVSKSMDGLDKKADNILSGILSMNTTAASINTIAANIQNSVTALEKDLASDTTELKTVTQNATKEITDSLNKLGKDLTSNAADLKTAIASIEANAIKAVKVNRWIIISVGVVVLFALVALKIFFK